MLSIEKMDFVGTSQRASSEPLLTTAVLFIIFNRPELTQQVFSAIQNAKPTRLYIAADGPRSSVFGEAQRCAEVKRIATAVDWDCEVHTLFREENLGCGKGPSTAITWFFEHETEGIILEDDCLPSASFFTFCTELLKHYRYDTRVMGIGGNNFEERPFRNKEYSFRFSHQTCIWGWATWRRAWKLHDFHMTHYEEVHKKRYLDASYNSIYERDFYKYIFSKMYEGDERTSSRTIWDYQWQFACMIHSGLTIVPSDNLVVNLGFGAHATNTLNPNGVGHNLVLEATEFPLRYPEFMMVDQTKDSLLFKFVNTSSLSRFRSQVKNLLPQKFVERLVKPLMGLLRDEKPLNL